jgi:hypothetical protein
MQPHSWEEALDMTSLLFNELCATAASEGDEALHPELRRIADRIDLCEIEIHTGEWEEEFQDLLFRMVERPLFELLTRVTLRFATNRPPTEPIYGDAGAIAGWKEGGIASSTRYSRGRALARFEANRGNRESYGLAAAAAWLAKPTSCVFDPRLRRSSRCIRGSARTWHGHRGRGT